MAPLPIPIQVPSSLANILTHATDLGEDGHTENEGVGGEADGAPMLPVVLPREVEQLAGQCVRVLHTRHLALEKTNSNYY